MLAFVALTLLAAICAILRSFSQYRFFIINLITTVLQTRTNTLVITQADFFIHFGWLLQHWSRRSFGLLLFALLQLEFRNAVLVLIVLRVVIYTVFTFRNIIRRFAHKIVLAYFVIILVYVSASLVVNFEFFFPFLLRFLFVFLLFILCHFFYSDYLILSGLYASF